MALLNHRKMKYSILKGSFSEDGISEFLRLVHNFNVLVATNLYTPSKNKLIVLSRVLIKRFFNEIFRFSYFILPDSKSNHQVGKLAFVLSVD